LFNHRNKPQGEKTMNMLRQSFTKLAVLWALAIVFLGLTFTTENFLSVGNLRNILDQQAFILIIAGLLIGCFLINEKRESLILPVVIAVAISLIVMPLIDSYKREKVSGFFLRVDAVLIWSYLVYIFKGIYKKLICCIIFSLILFL
jgi:ribose/xylose/arabinose/galactoside ABC-type transport system permease subunit